MDNYIIVNFIVCIKQDIIVCSAAADTLDLSYKYAVHSTQENSLECLLWAPHGDENTYRVLRVSKKKFLSDEGIYSKQLGMVVRILLSAVIFAFCSCCQTV